MLERLKDRMMGESAQLDGLNVFETDPSEARFDAMIKLVRDLSAEDYELFKKAMDAGYEARQTLKKIAWPDGIENNPEDDLPFIPRSDDEDEEEWHE